MAVKEHSQPESHVSLYVGFLLLPAGLGNIVFGLELGRFLLVLGAGVANQFTPFFAQNLGDISDACAWVLFLDERAAVAGVQEECGGWAFGARVRGLDL